MSSTHFSGNTAASSGDGGASKHDSRRSPDHLKVETGGELGHSSSGGRITQPEQFRKVFIGGLNYRTTETMLREYFSAYGEIVDCVVMQDQNGRSRGFGFVTYSKSTMVDELMRNRPHMIDRREVDVKRAMPKESGTPEIRLAVKKIFIGAIREGITEDDLKDYFSKYGMITDCVVMRDSNGLLRGFGFVEFDDCDPVDRIVLEKHHSIKGQSLDVKKAVPKKANNDGNARRTAGGSGAYSGGYSNGTPYSSRPYPTESLGYYGRGGGSDFFSRGSMSSSSRNVGSAAAGGGYGSLYDRGTGGGSSGGYDSFHGAAGGSRSGRDFRDNMVDSAGPSRPFYSHSRHQMPYESKEYHPRGRAVEPSSLYAGERGGVDSNYDDYADGGCFGGSSGSYPSQRGGGGSSYQPSRFSREVAKSPGYSGGSFNRTSYGSNPWSGNSERFPDRYSSRREDEGQFYDHRRVDSPIRDVDRMNAGGAGGARMRMSDNRGATTGGSDRNYGSLGSNGGGGAFMHDYPQQRSMGGGVSRSGGGGFSSGGANLAAQSSASGGYGSRYGGPSRPVVNRRYNYGGSGGGSYMDGYDGGKSGLAAAVRSTEGSYWSS